MFTRQAYFPFLQYSIYIVHSWYIFISLQKNIIFGQNKQ